jgi:hypothetical protein
MRFGSALLLAIGWVAATEPARAADSSTIAALEAYPTITSIGVYAGVTGDDDGDASAWVEYRATRAASFAVAPAAALPPVRRVTIPTPGPLHFRQS